uniref:Secreted peptide n=1 Tax=Anopheles braziliensis TaxID=58242 RepID=A0A2M3ZLZ5_9DIPT
MWHLVFALTVAALLVPCCCCLPILRTALSRFSLSLAFVPSLSLVTRFVFVFSSFQRLFVRIRLIIMLLLFETHCLAHNS